VVDPRTAFASPERFRDVEILAEWPQDAIPRIGLDPYTAVVVVAHVSHIDDEALKIALRSDCLYVGALGSSRNHAKRRERLAAAGMSEAEIARIKNPIGLDIGAQTPAEIAIAIMAEVILAVRGAKADRKG
jgi:xanthine dehydrogenase accessory factor